jgi:hypothetical protein
MDQHSAAPASEQEAYSKTKEEPGSDRALGEQEAAAKPHGVGDARRLIRSLGSNRALDAGDAVRNLERLAPHPRFAPDVEANEGETKDDEGEPPGRRKRSVHRSASTTSRSDFFLKNFILSRDLQRGGASAASTQHGSLSGSPASGLASALLSLSGIPGD